MSLFERALWVIERNSDQILTLTSIAAACGVSRSHLANAFGTASGWPVIAYLRARRLSQAAQRLADGAPDILSLAIETGYGSHEAFTRAFRDQFGETPEQVRRQGSLDGLEIVEALELNTVPVSIPAPRIATRGPLKLVGLAASCSFGEVMKIPAQWQRFATDHYYAIPSKVAQMPIGVCDVPNEEGDFGYICAVEVLAFGDRNPELTYFIVPPSDYAVFEHNTHVSRIFDTYSAIWNRTLPDMTRRVADSPVLEFHNDAFEPATGLGGVQIWIPLEKA